VLVARELLKIIVVILIEAIVEEAKKRRGRPWEPDEPPTEKGATK
jgi:hypothetical protein